MASTMTLPVPTSTTMLLSREASSNDGASTIKGGFKFGERTVEIGEEELIVKGTFSLRLLIGQVRSGCKENGCNGRDERRW